MLKIMPKKIGWGSGDNMVWKYIKRITYAIVIAVGLMLTYSLTDTTTRSKELKKVAEPALLAENYDVFVPSKYYNKVKLTDTVVVTENHKLRLMVYEVAYVTEDVFKNEIVRDGIVFIMHMLEGDTFGKYYGLKVKTETSEVEYLGRRVLDLPLYIAIDDETMTPIMDLALFNKDDIYQPIEKIEVYLEGEEDPYVYVDVNYPLEGFYLKEEMEAYHAENDTYPTSDIGHITLAEGLIIQPSKWLLINTILYIVISLGLTIFLFTYQKKKLGRKEPTDNLKRDIEKLK